MNKNVMVAALALGLILGASSAKAEQKITAVAGPVAGTGYIGIGAAGKEINTMYPDITVTLQPGSDMANPIRLMNNEVELAAQTIPMSVAAKKGVAPFKEAVNNVAAIANLRTQARLNIVVRADSGITSLEQLKEKKMPVRLAHGPRGSASEVFGRWVLTEYGIDFKDLTAWGGKLFANNFDDVANMVKDGQVDMMFWIGPGEAWFLTEMAGDTKLVWLPVSQKVIDSMHEQYLMTPAQFESGLYRGMITENVPAIGTSQELLVRENMPEDLVYKMTKAISEGRDNIALANPTWDGYRPETAWEGVSFPLHPGAVKYYKEKGYMK